MFRISQRCEYAVRALLELAMQTGPGPVTIAAVAEAQGLPRKFLSVILAQLKQVGLVESARGTHGGYRLALPPPRITIGRVLRLVDGPVESDRKSRGDGTPDANRDENALTEVRRQLVQAVEHVLDRTTLADLMEREKRRRAVLTTDYII